MYNFEALDSEKFMGALILGVEVGSADTSMGENSLENLGSIDVHILSLPQRDSGFLYIPGTSIEVDLKKAAVRGDYITVEGVPAAEELQLHYQTAGDDQIITLEKEITVKSDKTVTLSPDTVVTVRDTERVTGVTVIVTEGVSSVMEGELKIEVDSVFVEMDSISFYTDVFTIGTDTVLESDTDLVVEVDTVSTVRDTLSVTVYDDWVHKGKVIVDLEASGADFAGEFQVNFPFLIRLDDSNFNFTEAEPEGQDFLFSKSDGTLFPHQIEFWDAGTRSAAVWVTIDTLFTGPAEYEFDMFWGNSQANIQYLSSSVFKKSKDFGAVYHISESPEGDLSGAVKDHAFWEFHADPTGAMTGQNWVPGVIGKGLWFDGVDDGLIPASPSPGIFHDGFEAFTVSFWVKPDMGMSDTSVLAEIGGPSAGFVLGYAADSGTVIYGVKTDSDVPPVFVESETKIEPGGSDFVYVSAVYSYGTMSLYINGVRESGAVGLDSVGYHGNGPGIGFVNSLTFLGDEVSPFKGVMDEVRFSTTDRVPGYHKLAYESQRVGAAILRIE